MSWDTKGRHKYFYETIRVGDRVVKRYLGTGEKAKDAARRIERRRKDSQTQRDALQNELARVSVADQYLCDFRILTEAIVRCVLVAAGYHEHRGEWRQKREQL